MKTFAEQKAFLSQTGQIYYIESVNFPRIMVRMDGESSPHQQGPGFGTVNCQAPASNADGNPWEQFKIHYINTPNVHTVAFESVAYPGNYLRMAGVNSPSQSGPGFGTVNCQASIGPWEQFVIEFLPPDPGVNPPPGDHAAIMSAAFASNYLRLDSGGNTSFSGPGFGTVNCQASIGPYEKFYITTRWPGSTS